MLRQAQLLSLIHILLQPVVENAIRHGMRPDDRTLHIIIRTQSQDDNILNIIVQDDGVGIAEAQQQVLSLIHI